MGSRKKHRNRENEFYGNGGMENNNPLGLDFNTLSSLFGNIDQNQLMSMVQMLGQNGINMDNMGNTFNNMGNNNGFNKQNNNNLNNMNYNSNSNYGNNENFNNEKKSGELDTSTLINKLMGNNNEKSYEEIEKEKNLNEEKESMENDPNIEMLLSIRKIVNKERVRFIDKVIQLYLKGEFGEF